DRLHLNCQDNQPRRILRTIARYGFANMQAKGIQQIKLSDRTWTLCTDLPIGNAALMAAAIAQYLIADRRLSGIKINILLKQSFLHILCEKELEISKETIALPIIEALRQTHPVEYWHGISVYGKIKGEKSPAWKFDVDPSAICIRSNVRDKHDRKKPDSVAQTAKPLTSPNIARVTDKPAELQNIRESTSANTPTYQAIQDFLRLRWLGSTDVRSLEGKIALCFASLAIGIAATIAIGITLTEYLDRDGSQLKNVVGEGDRVDSSKIGSDSYSHDRQIRDYNNPSLNAKLVLMDSYIASLGRALM
ncbi:MAG: hypothetical protein HC935_09065, partial [Pseudanabaena sp. SU_2_4]|nr:hypothetical protein [Pseudanabaena sp. SU_2_4]